MIDRSPSPTEGHERRTHWGNSQTVPPTPDAFPAPPHHTVLQADRSPGRCWHFCRYRPQAAPGVIEARAQAVGRKAR
jgi:hypothetical protein